MTQQVKTNLPASTWSSQEPIPNSDDFIVIDVQQHKLVLVWRWRSDAETWEVLDWLLINRVHEEIEAFENLREDDDPHEDTEPRLALLEELRAAYGLEVEEGEQEGDD